MLQRCSSCLGKKEIMGAGMIFHKCKVCLGVGYVETKDNAEQDNFENTQITQAEADVDSSAPDSGEAKREQIGESTLGTGESHLSERKSSGKGRQKSRRNQSKEKFSGEQIQEN